MVKVGFFKVVRNIFICALFALVYVHQEIEIVKAGFLVNKHRHEVSFLLDQYRSLVYNLSRLESPKRIEDRLSLNEIVLCMPKTENKRALQETRFAYNEEKGNIAKPSLLARVFDRFSAKAEAKAVK